jgi:hypothetical protein
VSVAVSCRSAQTFRVMVDRARTSDAIVQVVELDDPTVVFENLPALVSRIELEPRASTTSTSRGSAIERAENLDSIPLRQTVRSRGPPHRSLRQDWKRFLAASIGRYACATFEESPSSRLGRPPPDTLCITCEAQTPLAVTPMQAVSAGPRRAPRSILLLTPSSYFRRASRAG